MGVGKAYSNSFNRFSNRNEITRLHTLSGMELLIENKRLILRRPIITIY